MGKSNDSVSYLRAVCFVSSDLQFVVAYTVTTRSRGKLQKYFFIMQDHVQKNFQNNRSVRIN